MSDNNETGLWVKEIHKEAVGLSFKVVKTLFSGRSEYQKVDVVLTENHGALLLNDGLMMLSERDEFIYHEMIAHVPLFAHPNPKKVLVIGGGDGGSVREILKHRGVERVVLVEIDEMVVSACKEHIPKVSCALEDPRLDLLIRDGIKYIAETDEVFDVIMVDSTDPVGPAAPLFNKAFYQGVEKKLSSDGILITQAESPFYDGDIQKSMLLNQREFFPKLHLYLFPMLTYPGGLWSFGFASKGLCPVADFNADRYLSSGITTDYYNGMIHRSSFMLPNFIQKSLGDVIDPIVWD